MVFVAFGQKIIIYINFSFKRLVIMYCTQKVRIEVPICKPAVGYWLLNSSIVHHIENTVHIQT